MQSISNPRLAASIENFRKIWRESQVSGVLGFWI